MTITASPRQTVLRRAKLPAATQAFAQIADRTPQLDQSSSINKPALDCTYLIIPPRSIKQPITPIHRHSARPAPRSKSP